MKVKIFVLVIIALIVTPIHYINFKSLQEQVFLYVDFNNYQSNLRTPLEMVAKFRDEFPTLTNVAMPIKLAKANYYIQNKQYEKALELIEEGIKDNPFMFLGEFQKAKIFYQLKNYEKAKIFGKIAFDSLPNNSAHTTMYQMILAELKEVDELKRIFNLTKHNQSEAVWSNHLYLMSVLDHEDNVYSEDTKRLAEESLKLFPNNSIIKGSELVISDGIDIVYLANQFDKLANEYYDNEEYEEAIIEWRNALNVIPDDSAYYLNIAKSLSLLGRHVESNATLQEIEDKGIKTNDGMFEFQKGLNLIELKSTKLACEFLKKSMLLGYKPSIRAVKIYKCY